jgi:hypothetical protein
VHEVYASGRCIDTGVAVQTQGLIDSAVYTRASVRKEPCCLRLWVCSFCGRRVGLLVHRGPHAQWLAGYPVPAEAKNLPQRTQQLSNCHRDVNAGSMSEPRLITRQRRVRRMRRTVGSVWVCNSK